MMSPNSYSIALKSAKMDGLVGSVVVTAGVDVMPGQRERTQRNLLRPAA